MKMWGFVLAIFIYSLLSVAINDTGLMTVGEINDFNSDNITAGTATIKEIVTTDSMQSEESFFSFLPGADALFIIIKMFSVLIESLKMTAWVLPTLRNLGMPLALAMMFQTIVTFMEGIFLFQVWRRFKIEN